MTKYSNDHALSSVMAKLTLGVAALTIGAACFASAQAQSFGGMPTIAPRTPAQIDADKKKNDGTKKEVEKPNYLIVDSRKSRKDAYTSIQAAVNDVAWGGVIVVLPGDYHENLDIRKAVTIQGDRGPGVSVRIYPQDSSKPCLNYEPFGDSDHTLISNVEFRTTTRMSRPAIESNQAYGKVANNDTVSDVSCIAVKSGVFTMKESTVDGGGVHAGALVEISGGTATLEKNTISGGLDGVLVAQHHPLWDRTFLVDNDISDNRYTGVHLTGVSSMLATGNVIADNGQGLVYNGEGEATVVGNKILNNRGTGVILDREAKQVLIRLNQIWSNDGDGVKIYRSNGLIEDNDINGNGGFEINTRELMGNEPKIINDVPTNVKSYTKKR